MRRWPPVDRELRRRLLDQVRRRHNREASEMPALHRLGRLDELLDLARSVGHGRPGSDEPVDLWLQMKARFRQAGERR